MRILNNVVQNSFLAANKNQLESKYSINSSCQKPSLRNKISFNGLDALIFDADGTMVHSGTYHKKAWLGLCFNHPPKKIINLLIKPPNSGSGTTEDRVKALYGNISPAKIIKYTREKEARFLNLAKNLKEVNGLTDFIKSVPEIKKGIATNASTFNINFYLHRINLAEHFNQKHIITSSMVTKGKPDPEEYIKAVKALGVLPENCVAFEDSAEGIKAAKAAGLKVIGIATSLSKEKLAKLGATLSIKDYTEINLSKITALFEKEVLKLK